MMGHYKDLAKQKIESIKGQILYCREVLKNGHLENWEAKEYSDLKINLNMRLKVLEKHFAENF